MKEECGVIGIFGDPESAKLAYYGLYALQHRGQESAGIAVSNGKTVNCHKGMGLVSEVFTPEALGSLRGIAAVGHVRYSTFGSSQLLNAQPLVVRFRRGTIALAHNGNLVNAVTVRRMLEDEGSIFQTGVDTEVLAHLIARQGRIGIEDAVASAIAGVRGGYALTILNEDRLIGIRDPNGIRPLSLGKLSKGYVLASETCAFDAIGAETIRDIAPGEMVVIDDNGVRSRQAIPAGSEAFCAFEYIYFARPDSNLRGLNVHAVRKHLGRRLARDFPVEADLVTGVPDSSLSAASGFAEEAGIPYELGLVKNRYIGRTFIQPTQEMRSVAVRLKLNALRKVIEGKRVVLVDDSIVRGTTSQYIVRLLRDSGAREVHLRISSPPYRYPCYFGIDTSASNQLLAASLDTKRIERWVGADSLRFLSVDALAETICGGKEHGLCFACFDGKYPVDVSDAASKYRSDEEYEGRPDDGALPQVGPA